MSNDPVSLSEDEVPLTEQHTSSQTVSDSSSSRVEPPYLPPSPSSSPHSLPPSLPSPSLPYSLLCSAPLTPSLFPPPFPSPSPSPPLQSGPISVPSISIVSAAAKRGINPKALGLSLMSPHHPPNMRSVISQFDSDLTEPSKWSKSYSQSLLSNT